MSRRDQLVREGCLVIMMPVSSPFWIFAECLFIRHSPGSRDIPPSRLAPRWNRVPARAAFEQVRPVGRIIAAQSADPVWIFGGLRFAHPPYKGDPIQSNGGPKTACRRWARGDPDRSARPRRPDPESRVPGLRI